MSPQFSVIVTNYNNARYIPEALLSVKRQTLQDYELIVVENASTDNSREVIERLAPSFGEKIRCAHLHPNRGPSGARNTGISMARGSYIAFLDSDDFWHPERLALQAEVFSRYPSVGFCCSDFRILYADGRSESHFDRWVGVKGFPYHTVIPAAEAFRLLLRVNFVGTGVASIRRSCVQKVGGFDSRYPQAEDYDLWLRIAMVADFYVLPEMLYSYRVHGNGLTSNRRENIECSRKVLENILEESRQFIAENELSSSVRASIAATWYDAGNGSFEDGGIREAFASYCNALTADPSPENAGRFIARSGRKAIRALTFGVLSRKTLSRVANELPFRHKLRS